MIVINLLRVKWGVLFPSCKFDYYLYSFDKFTNFTGVFCLLQGSSSSFFTDIGCIQIIYICLSFLVFVEMISQRWSGIDL